MEITLECCHFRVPASAWASSRCDSDFFCETASIFADAIADQFYFLEVECRGARRIRSSMKTVTEVRRKTPDPDLEEASLGCWHCSEALRMTNR
ncbi:MAG: hypothetical protein ACJ8FZ_04390 [Bradyrhizobium sp.]|jgi:hypothetical protein